MQANDGYARVEILIEGITPHVQHNGRLADPADSFSIRIKEITKKRNKTEADYKAIEELEWEASLYYNHESRAIVPGNVLEGAYFGAGKERRQGQDVRRGISVPEDWPLIYKGPQTVDGLRADPNFRFRCIVTNPSTKGRTARVRPIFRQWQLKYALLYRTSLFNLNDVVMLTNILAVDIGLSDDRSKGGGRFRLVKTVPAPKE
jgi:hypothetical protein